jgi:hypothetical protein
MSIDTINSYEGEKYYIPIPSVGDVVEEISEMPGTHSSQIKIEYITFYSLNKQYIWGGLFFIGFMIAYYILLFSIYLRTNAYKNNICAPFTQYDYDVNACNNAIYNIYWNGKDEGFEDRTSPKKRGKGILANIYDGGFSIIDSILLIPKSIWKIADKLKNASENIHTEISKKTDPYYYEFTKKINRAIKLNDASIHE